MMEYWYSLVELLPFEWAAPGGMYFFKNAILASLVMAPLFGILSTMVISNRMSFFSDALGHSVFTGMVIGALFGLVEPVWCAIGLSVAFALLFSYVRYKSNISTDTVIGVLSSTAIALGIFIATTGGRSFTKFNTYLIGDMLSISPHEIGLLFITLVLVTIMWVFSINRLTLSSIHPELADSRGVKVLALEGLFSVSIALVVTLAISWVGLLVINSLLVLPASAARNVSKNMRSYHLFSLLFALFASLTGLFISYFAGSSAGATISLILAFLFVVTFIIKRK